MNDGSSGPARGARGGWLAALAFGALLLARRRRVRRAWGVLAALGLLACNATPEVPFRTGNGDHPTAGLYTPGSMVGAPPIDRDASADAASNPLQDAINQVSGTERCVKRDEAGTPGELTATFFSATYGGFYSPENCGAVWIEDEEGNYVSTALLWAGLRTQNLFVWDARRCSQDRPDVISGATLPDHVELHEAKWDGKDQSGKVVPDGMYVLNIEITEDEFDYGRHAKVPFMKGAEAQTLAPEDSESVKGLTLVYTPSAP